MMSATGRAVTSERPAAVLPVPRPVLVRHDDGQWYPGKLLHAYLAATGWRAVVRYSTAPGAQYERGVAYEDLHNASGR